MSITIDALVKAGFPRENFPEDLPEPGPETIRHATIEGDKALYRYDAQIDGANYAMEIVIQTKTVPDPAEGVGFMLNQLAYLWRMDRPKLAVAPDGACRRIHF